MDTPSQISPPERWFDAHAEPLFRYAMARLRRRADAEDAVQETLLAALRSSREFRGDSTERTWLIGILNHKVVDQIRAAERREGMTDLDADAEFFAANDRWKRPPAALVIDDVDLVENEEFWQQVDRCLDGLPARQARAFSLYSIEDHEPEAACKQLGVSTTNLWVLLHRARLRLRACLEVNWFHAGDER
jgi:RNA polymerase sigma-70 factor (ECF subfamily)